LITKFPSDAPKRKVLKTLKKLGFKIVRQKEHISMMRENPDGSKTPLTMPNHRKIKASTSTTLCNQSGITREEFLKAYRKER